MGSIEGVYSDFLLHRMGDKLEGGGCTTRRHLSPIRPGNDPLPTNGGRRRSGAWPIPRRICTTAERRLSKTRSCNTAVKQPVDAGFSSLMLQEQATSCSSEIAACSRCPAAGCRAADLMRAVGQAA